MTETNEKLDNSVAIYIAPETMRALDDMLCHEAPNIESVILGLIDLTRIQAEALSDYRSDLKLYKAVVQAAEKFKCLDDERAKSGKLDMTEWNDLHLAWQALARTLAAVKEQNK